MGEVNNTSILYDSNGNYLTWSKFSEDQCFHVLALNNPLSTMIADVDFADNYYGEREFKRAKDVPKDAKIQMRRGFTVNSYMHAIAISTYEEDYGLLSIQVPNNEPKKFFQLIHTKNGFKLKSSHNGKYVINEANFFYAKGDSEEDAYEFQNH